MIAYVARRLIEAVPLLLVITLLLFVIIQMTGDPLAAYTVDATLTGDLRGRQGGRQVLYFHTTDAGALPRSVFTTGLVTEPASSIRSGISEAALRSMPALPAFETTLASA